MPAIIDFLYKEYCRARLAEMRKQLWLSAPSLQIYEARDAGDPAGSSDRDSVSDDRTAAQHEARIH